jgi:hypothetical protein
MESQLIAKVFEQYLSKILKDISEHHDIDYGDLIDRYIRPGPSSHHIEDSVQVTEYEYDKTMYFIDQKMNIYSHEQQHPKLIGVKLVDGSIKFFDESDY